ncbi:protocadherin gamma-A5-like isoform X25 [Ambystoma mexicanum]|uniref:protocadherin gamma-A5-like isoform X25 n=1 Tax=Ambystoma mexicanum TaxID=8296 RepID=UPI0037E79A26
MAWTPRIGCGPRAPLLLVAAMLTVWGAASGQLRYSIPEEMKKGSFVGNVALDLGMDPQELSEGGARIVSRGRKQYFTLNANNGHLYISERIDRESICVHVAECTLNVEIIAENIMKAYAVEVAIKDINDNFPTFIDDEIQLEVNENTAPGTRFVLPGAHDADEGVNSIQNYELSADKHFTLNVTVRTDSTKYAQLVLQKSLDREEQEFHSLILTATDGGHPARSGTVRIQIHVLDANDNAPVFDQPVYKISVLENVPKRAVVGTIRATDIDQELNSKIIYSFDNIKEVALKKFSLDSKTGELSLIEQLDFEETEFYEFEVRGSDGSLSSRCKVLIEVINVNDNSPEILMSYVLKQISENSPMGTVIALLQVYDRDSGVFGKVTCFLPPHLPFQLNKSIGSYYSLVNDGLLDREQVSQYNITIAATDSGVPPLSKTETINLHITDENDNPPVFDKVSYSAYIMENIPQGSSIFAAKATDSDWGKNAKISYSIVDGHIGDVPLSSYISINSESGVIYALQSFDFEKFRDFQIQVKAQDGGSPALASNVTVTFFILDQNDNTPEILYPSAPTDGSSGVEMAPRSSEPGYLITKVVAVDGDSGQNAWLSYQLLRATEQGLFTVGLHTGEIRTGRPILEKDAIKHYLVVSVRDNGQTPLSASVTVTIVLADSMPEMLHDVSNPSAPTDMESDLTLYLVIAVAVVSFLFLFLIILLVAIRLHHWRESQLSDSSGVNFHSLPASQFVGIDGVRAFLQTYSHDACLTTDSGKSQIMFPITSHSDTLSGNQNDEKQGCHLIEDFLSIGKEEQPFIQQAQPFQQSQPFQQAPPNTDWRFSQAQRPGTSGSQNSEEAGGWPNNQFETERLQAMILASANEGADGSSTLGGGAGTMGLSTRYGPQFTLQHVPDYRQNVYIPGSTATLTNAAGKRDGKSAAASGGNKKKSGKKEKK